MIYVFSRIQIQLLGHFQVFIVVGDSNKERG